MTRGPRAGAVFCGRSLPARADAVAHRVVCDPGGGPSGREKTLPELLYEKEETCALCGEKFRVTKVRKSACPVVRRDPDFCVYYQNENPNLYDIWVCPHCGYAAPESSWNDLLEAQRKLLRDWLTSQPKLPDLSGRRTPETAIMAYDRAIACAVAKRGRDSQIAGLYLKAAWVYRVSGANDPREAEYIQKAAEHYEKAYQTEPTPIGTMTDATLRYLIGELLRRCGRYKEACLYFSQLVSDPAVRGDARIGNLAREQWQLAKQQLQAQEAGVGASDAAGQPPSAAATSEAAAAAGQVAPFVAQSAPVASRAVGASRMSESAGGDGPSSVPARRARVTASVPLYAEQIAWARAVVRANQPGALDTGAVLRAALAIATAVDPTALRAGDEEELKAKLLAAIRE